MICKRVMYKNKKIQIINYKYTKSLLDDNGNKIHDDKGEYIIAEI